MQGLRQRLLLWLCQFNRMHQSYPGRWRVCRYLTRQAPRLMTLPPLKVKIAVDTYVHLDPKEKYDGFKTLVYGLNAREPLSNLTLQILRRGDTALDIGANVGYFTALASQAVGATGAVYAFEASPATYSRLQTLVGRNRWNNIHGFPVAASDKAGEVDLYSGPADHTGTTSMRDLGDRATAKTRIKAIAVDDMLDQLPPVRLIKIDVEGAESLVTRGMTRLLNRDRPYILVEVTNSFLQSLGSNKTELIGLYEDLGYRPWRVGRKVIPYEAMDEYQCDVLLVPHDAPAFQFDEQLLVAAPR